VVFKTLVIVSGLSCSKFPNSSKKSTSSIKIKQKWFN